MKKPFLVIFISFICLLLVSACGQGGDDQTEEENGGQDTAGSLVETTEDEQAYAIFQSNCMSCHATDLSGNMGEKSNLQQVGNRLSRDEIADVITNGREGTSMMAFSNRLEADQIASLADWLSKRK